MTANFRVRQHTYAGLMCNVFILVNFAGKLQKAYNAEKMPLQLVMKWVDVGASVFG